jgi:hypothetical protein
MCIEMTHEVVVVVEISQRPGVRVNNAAVAAPENSAMVDISMARSDVLRERMEDD